MEGFNHERRGLFDGLKVPFDLSSILFAFLCIVVFKGGTEVISALTGDERIVQRAMWSLLGAVGVERGGAPIEPLTPITWLVFGAFVVLIWAFFGGAINRIAAMKIAREEGVEVKDAAKFAAQKLPANVMTVLFVVGIVGLFYLVFNATIGGWIGRIPYAGDILVGALFPLVLLSTFFLVFALALGVLGANLATSAVATEASDTFDGVSRAWNYILARPWQVILYYALIAGYIFIVCSFGQLFLETSVKSMAVGWWGYGEADREVTITHQEKLPREDGSGFAIHVETETVTVPGKARYLHGYVFDSHYEKTLKSYPQPVSEEGGAVETRDVTEHLEGTLTHWAAPLTWAWVKLAKYILYAYLLSYFFSAHTLVYFLLRKDVEGDDYNEINLEDDDDDEAFDIGSTPPPPPPPAAEPPKTEGDGEKKDEGKVDV